MKKFLLLIVAIFCALGVSAQNTRIISGVVIDKNGIPLPNAIVEAIGGAESVNTDADGSFRIEVPVWLKFLTAKCTGYKDKKVELSQANQIFFEMKSKPTPYWFLDAVGSVNFGDSDAYGRVGLMGGYLADWGGYAKVLLPMLSTVIPSVTAGVIKRISDPVYLYLGAGYAPKFYYDYYHGEDHWDYYSGAMIDFGAVFKIKKFNINVGYSILVGADDAVHSIQLGVGYCF